jgi:hypothetical protein
MTKSVQTGQTEVKFSRISPCVVEFANDDSYGLLVHATLYLVMLVSSFEPGEFRELTSTQEISGQDILICSIC